MPHGMTQEVRRCPQGSGGIPGPAANPLDSPIPPHLLSLSGEQVEMGWDGCESPRVCVTPHRALRQNRRLTPWLPWTWAPGLGRPPWVCMAALLWLPLEDGPSDQQRNTSGPAFLPSLCLLPPLSLSREPATHSGKKIFILDRRKS